MSFSATSRNITLSGSVLSADCGFGTTGNFNHSSLDLDDVLGNNNGNFQIHGTGWFNSAIEVRLFGQSLTAVLLDVNGQGHPGQLNLDEFIANQHGQLVAI